MHLRIVELWSSDWVLKNEWKCSCRLTMKELDKIANIQVNCEHALQILVDFFPVINNHGKETSSYFPSLLHNDPYILFCHQL